MRPQKPCSTRNASTLSRLISTVLRLMNPNFAMTRRLVIATSVERMLIQAQMRNTSPITMTSVRSPSRTSQNCDHHDMRPRCRSVSPSTRDWSMYDMSEVRREEEELHQLLEAGRVVGVEACEHGAVEVEHAEDLHGAHHRHDDLAARGAVARDVPGKLLDV